MKILAFETSCDDTAVSIVEDGVKVLGAHRVSQIEHGEYGGVVPELAARLHAERWTEVLEACLEAAKLKFDDIDAVAVTQGPGLQTSLLNGTTAASFLHLIHEKPLIPVHHIYGHIVSPVIEREIDEFQLPALVLTVSGGHTEMHLLKDWTTLERVGSTRDDACGEAFDKVAKMLGLGYPGGPIVSKRALSGDSEAFNLPRIMLEKETLDFSFSGLKASIYRLIQECDDAQDETFINDVCASFQQCVCDIFERKLKRALDVYPHIQTVFFVGGVSANTQIRETLTAVCKERKIDFYTPAQFEYCTDNASMIAAAAYLMVRSHPEILQTPSQFVDSTPRFHIDDFLPRGCK